MAGCGNSFACHGLARRRGILKVSRTSCYTNDYSSRWAMNTCDLGRSKGRIHNAFVREVIVRRASSLSLMSSSVFVPLLPRSVLHPVSPRRGLKFPLHFISVTRNHASHSGSDVPLDERTASTRASPRCWPNAAYSMRVRGRQSHTRRCRKCCARRKGRPQKMSPRAK